jgi:hypothetical protein
MTRKSDFYYDITMSEYFSMNELTREINSGRHSTEAASKLLLLFSFVVIINLYYPIHSSSLGLCCH